MIKVSEIAAFVLAESLRASGVGPGQGLRLKEAPDRLILELDTPQGNERVIKHEGQAVLILDHDFELSFGDALIDVEELAEGPELVIRRSVPG